MRIAARAIVQREGRVLVQRPTDDPEACYAFIGGGYEPSDTLIGCLKREFEEETNARVVACAYLFCAEYRWQQGDVLRQSLVHFFSVRLDRVDVESREAHLAQHWLPLATLKEYDLRPQAIRDLVAEGRVHEVRHLVLTREGEHPETFGVVENPKGLELPDAEALLRALLAGVREVLGERLVGVYVHGSLASGDFDPLRSDIDFLVVTDGPLPDEVLPALEAMHARLAEGGQRWADKLEGSYIPRDALRRYDPACSLHPALRVGGPFGLDGHGVDWVIQRHVLRERGIALAGPDLRDLIDPLSPDDLRRAARATLEEWWAPQLRDASRLQEALYRAYAVLTMCRALYTIQHGAVVTKAAAARWAQGALGERWAPLIERALAWPRDGGEVGLEETLSHVRYTVERERGIVV
jgi:8-oxo-dGTP pyrophosphatase MutT (NUDIX family)